MKIFIVVLTLMSAASSFAAKFECQSAAEREGTIINVTVDDSHRNGTITIGGQSLNLSCTGGLGFVLECKAYVANTGYEVAISRFHTRTGAASFQGSVRHFIGGVAGNIEQELGQVYCDFL